MSSPCRDTPSKSRLCVPFRNHGKCIMGEACRFSHATTERNNTTPAGKNENGNNTANSPSSSSPSSPSNAAGIDPSEIACRFYGLKSSCLMGEKCQMKHSDMIARVNRTTHCRAFKASKCPRGDSCPFSHDLNTPQLCRQHFCYGKCTVAAAGEDHCEYSHSLDNSTVRPVSSSTDQERQQTPASASPRVEDAPSNDAPYQRRSPKIVVVMRHGERIDNHADQTAQAPENPNENSAADPALTRRGYAKAKTEVAEKLLAACYSILPPSTSTSTSSKNDVLRISIIVSPFLRCLQTASALMEGFSATNHQAKVTRITIDNKFSEILNAQTIKECRDTRKGPCLVGNPWDILLNANDQIQSKDAIERTTFGSLAQFGEPRESAYARYASRLREVVKQKLLVTSANETSNEVEDADVVLIVSHGDALSACMQALYGTNRVVYSCEYLGYYFVTRRSGNSTCLMPGVEVVAADGVEWYDE